MPVRARRPAVLDLLTSKKATVAFVMNATPMERFWRSWHGDPIAAQVRLLPPEDRQGPGDAQHGLGVEEIEALQTLMAGRVSDYVRPYLPVLRAGPVVWAPRSAFVSSSSSLSRPRRSDALALARPR